MNKKYTINISDEPRTNDVIRFEDNLNIIKNNQGIYSDQDYKKIIEYINKLESVFNFEYDKKMLQKNIFTYTEMVELYLYNLEYLNLSIISNYIYNDNHLLIVLNKYNSNIIKEIVDYYQVSNLLITFESDVLDKLKAPYYNNEDIDNNVLVEDTGIVQFKYHKENILLEMIIKAGEINE